MSLNAPPLTVPFIDLARQHEPIRLSLEAAIREVLDTSAFAGGPIVARFEEEFAAYCGTRYAVGVGSGTEALWLSLLALGIGPGDEVITVPNTFMATAEAISFCGARPVFVDVDPIRYTMDPDQLRGAISVRTKAIIPVHLFGQTADMKPILRIGMDFGIPIVEDACQAHGAEYAAARAGAFGTTGCFSFYPGKNLGALGEAGCVVTNDTQLYERLQTLRDHGQPRKYHHNVVGWNARMDGIQAAALRVKLRHLPRWNEQRRRHAEHYRQLLSSLPGVLLPIEAPFGRHVYHLYAVRLRQRDAVLQAMTRAGITCGIHYPVPVHLQEAYRHLGLGPGSFPVSEDLSRELLSLPLYPELRLEQLEYVALTLRRTIQQLADHAKPA